MLQQDARILWNHEIAKGVYRLGLACDGFKDTAQPGQFVMLHLKQHHPVLLRRPFSIHRLLFSNVSAPDMPAMDSAVFGAVLPGETGIEIIYKVVGTVTTALAAAPAGAAINLIGPLGRGFGVPANARRVVLTGGGMGIAPLYFLVQHLMQHFPDVHITLFLGGRSAPDLIALQEFRKLDLPVHIATEDGSSGRQCLITHPLECLLKECRQAELPLPEVIFACGPVGMLACVADLAKRLRIGCQVSVETMMACGIGACLGCACPAPGAGRYRHACQDGPVFDASELDLAHWPD